MGVREIGISSEEDGLQCLFRRLLGMETQHFGHDVGRAGRPGQRQVAFGIRQPFSGTSGLA